MIRVVRVKVHISDRRFGVSEFLIIASPAYWPSMPLFHGSRVGLSFLVAILESF